MTRTGTFTALEWAILETVAYADIFDYPLTPSEIQRYLIGVHASPEDISSILECKHLNGNYLSQTDGYYSLAGREFVVEHRRQRARAASALWPVARYYGQLIGSLPFVRMVAVTGSLAADNTEPGSDIDYLIVTAPQRLWLCRLLVIALVKWAARRGYTLCPNYFVSENALAIQERNLFSARELAQMVPVAGLETYHLMRRANRWTDDYLPNAAQHPPDQIVPSGESRSINKRLTERVLRTRLGTYIDAWEMRRKIRKLTGEHPTHSEAAFSADWCKGHFDGHMQRILDAYNDRVNTLRSQHHAQTNRITETV
jgi:hypothetical protein